MALSHKLHSPVPRRSGASSWHIATINSASDGLLRRVQLLLDHALKQSVRTRSLLMLVNSIVRPPSGQDKGYMLFKMFSDVFIPYKYFAFRCSNLR